MQSKLILIALEFSLCAATLFAQPQPPPAPWRGPGAAPCISSEAASLLAGQNVQTDLRAGFTAARDMSTHGNGYGDIAIRDAINRGVIDGPRYRVSTLGIVWGDKPPDPSKPDNPLAGTVVRSVE